VRNKQDGRLYACKIEKITARYSALDIATDTGRERIPDYAGPHGDGALSVGLRSSEIEGELVYHHGEVGQQS
jgi:hypothetical protein